MPVVPTRDSFNATSSQAGSGARFSDAGMSAEAASRGSREIQLNGRAIQQASTDVLAIQADRMNVLNRARALNAATRDDEFVLNIQKELTDIKGEAVAKRPDGKPLDMEFLERFDAHQSENMASLSNDAQRQAYAEQSQLRRLALQEQVTNHMIKESNAFTVSTANGSIQTAYQKAMMNPSYSAQALEDSDAAIQLKADTLGWSEAETLATKQAVRGKIYSAGIKGMLEQDPAMAVRMYESVVGQLPLDDSIVLSKAIKSTVDGQISAQASERTASEYKNDFFPTDTSTLVRSIIQTESSNDPQAVPRDEKTGKVLSTAYGWGQFIDETWNKLVDKYEPDLREGRTPEQVNDLRTDKVTASRMVEYLAKENAQALVRAGVEATPNSIYLAHMVSPIYAAAMLKASPDTPLNYILPQKFLDSNPKLMKTKDGSPKNVGDVLGWVSRKMAGVSNTQPPIEATFVQNAREAAASAGGSPEAIDLAGEKAQRQHQMLMKARTDTAEQALTSGIQVLINTQGDMAQVPQNVLDTLLVYDPKQHKELMLFAKALQTERTTNPEAYTQAVTEEGFLTKLTDAGFILWGTQNLSEADFKSVAKMRADAVAGTSTNTPESLPSGFKDFVKLDLAARGVDDPKKMAKATTEISRLTLEKQRELGRKLTDVDMQQLLDNYNKQGLVSYGLLMGQQPESVASITIGDISSDVLKQMRDRLTAVQGGRPPTDDQILRWYKAQKMKETAP